MRMLICIFVLVIYLASFNTYIFCLDSGQFGIRFLKLWYNYTTFGLLAFAIIDEIIGCYGYHKSLNRICKFSLLLNYILIILTHHDILLNPVTKFMLYNGSVLVITLMILLSAAQHDYFKQTHENE